MKSNCKVDWSLVVIPIIIIGIVSSLFMIFPEASTNVMTKLQDLLTNKLGVVYIIFGAMILGTAITLSVSRHGKIKLGTTKPEHSNSSWAVMILTSTFAADILYWSFIEWSYYYSATPKGETMSLAQAQDAASTYTLFHWGPIPWAIYLVPAAAYAYMFYVKGRTRSRLSEACRPVIGNKVDGVVGKIIDIFALVGLLAGTATTFSVTTPLMSSLISQLTGLSASRFMTISILLIIALVYTITVLKGIKGISNLAKICSVAFGILVALIFIPGPKSYIIESGVSGIGNMLNNLISLCTWTDPARQSGGFVQSWTIFYWAYWISWAVATPLFIAKISKGRTIRNTILGGMGYGMLGTYISFIVISNTSLYHQIHGDVNAVEMISNGESAETTIVSIINSLPGSSIIMIVLLLTMVLLYATTFDSISLTISDYCMRSEDAESPKWLRVLWSIVFIILPIALIYASSVLNTLKMLSIVAAFPLMIILSTIVYGFIKSLRRDNP